jgi:hypothetical protein
LIEAQRETSRGTQKEDLIEPLREPLIVVLREVLTEVSTEVLTLTENGTGTVGTITVIMIIHFLQETGSQMVDGYHPMTKDMIVHSRAGEVRISASLGISGFLGIVRHLVF